MENLDLPYSYDFDNLSFHYKKNAFGPKPELRRLDAIRKSLLDPESDGPEIVYSIAMDVGFNEDRNDLKNRGLLYGTVIYNSGYISGQKGREPIRSQGHIHIVSLSCGSSTAELYEIHSGIGIIYMQEICVVGSKETGRCFAVKAYAGETVLVPPCWAHLTISVDPEQALGFGAWCVRDYGFDYRGVWDHGGLAYFPIINSDGDIIWRDNSSYEAQDLIEKTPQSYHDFGLTKSGTIYQQYKNNREVFDFIPQPHSANKLWLDFIP